MTSSRATPLTKTLIAITLLAGGLTGPSDINTGLKSWGIPPDPSELTLSAEQSAKIFKSVGAGFERLGTRAIAANHLSQAFAPTPASTPTPAIEMAGFDCVSPAEFQAAGGGEHHHEPPKV